MKFTLGALAMAALSATAQVPQQAPLPYAKNFTESSQHKVRAAGHWKALSHDAAQKTTQALAKSGYKDAALYVSPGVKKSEFETAFNDFLVTDLVNSGVKVQSNNANALSVNYSTQIVNHNSKRVDFEPYRYTKLTAGLFVLGALAADSALGAGVATMGLAAAKDLMGGADAGGPSMTELILTTTIMDGTKYVTRQSDVYYIETIDAALFQTVVAPKDPKAMMVVAQ